MTKDTVEILCGKCRAPLIAPTNPKPSDPVVCSRCGATASYKTVMEQAQSAIMKQTQDALSKSLSKAFKGSKNIKFTPKRH